MPLSKSEADLLSALWANPDQPLTARDIEQHTGIREPTARRVAQGLAYAGLLSQVHDRPAAWRITGSGRAVLNATPTDRPTPRQPNQR